jgi:putative membrane protein
MMINDKAVFRLITGVSIFVFLVVAVLQSHVIQIFPEGTEVPQWVFFLPKLNAMINGTCSVLLLVSLYQIKRGKIQTHKVLNMTTFILSSGFLVSYIIFHATGIRTSYGGEGLAKYIYYFILITHIILAAVVLPVVLLSFYSGLKGNVARHRKLVRWSFPIWLYVTVTGVIVYLMIAPYYTFG